MSASGPDRNSAPLPTPRQEGVEEYLRSHQPLAPAWLEAGAVLATVRGRTRRRAFGSRSIALAWLCGIAAGVVMTIGAQGLWPANSDRSADRLASGEPRENRVATESIAEPTPQRNELEEQTETPPPFTLVLPGEMGFIAMPEGMLDAGSIRRIPPRSTDIRTKKPLPRPSACDHEDDKTWRPLAPLRLTPASQRELLRQFGGTDVVSLLR